MTNNNLNGTETMLMKKAEYEVNGEKITLSPGIIKQYLVSGDASKVTDQEVVVFMKICQGQKLNPFLREAYLVKFGSSPASMVVGKDTFTKRAEKNPKYKGFKAGIIVQRDKQMIDLEGSFCLKTDILLGGWAEVYIEGKQYPVVARVNLEEYASGQSTWKNKPKTMIRKVALVQALREAFPMDFEGLYSPEEIQEVNPDDLPDNPVDPEEEKLKKQEVDSQPAPATKGQKEYLFGIAKDKGLAEGKDVSKLEALANENGISLRALTYESADKLVKLVEEYQEVVEVESTPVEGTALNEPTDEQKTEDEPDPF